MSQFFFDLPAVLLGESVDFVVIVVEFFPYPEVFSPDIVADLAHTGIELLNPLASVLKFLSFITLTQLRPLVDSIDIRYSHGDQPTTILVRGRALPMFCFIHLTSDHFSHYFYL